MKITRRQLNKIIFETLLLEQPDAMTTGVEGGGAPASDKSTPKKKHPMAKTWDAYVKSPVTGGKAKGEKVRDGWIALCEQDSSLGDGSFKSWKSWYAKSIKDPALMATIGMKKGKQISPDQVIKLYQGLTLIEPKLEPTKIDAGLTQAEANAAAKAFNDAISNTKSEEEKKNIIQKSKDFGKRIASRFPKIKFKMPTKTNKSQAETPVAYTLEGVPVKNLRYDPKEAMKMANKIKKANPKKYAIVYGSHKIGSDIGPGKLFALNNNKEIPYRIVRIPTTDDSKMVTIVVATQMQESLSRGSLYRQRYRRY